MYCGTYWSISSRLKDYVRKKDIMSLEQDFTTVPGQLFACLSIVGPECPQKNEKFGIKRPINIDHIVCF